MESQMAARESRTVKRMRMLAGACIAADAVVLVAMPEHALAAVAVSAVVFQGAVVRWGRAVGSLRRGVALA